MKKSVVFMFSGQGSQYYEMGKELYENHPRFRLWMDYCDEIAEPHVRCSLIDVLYGQYGRAEPFDQILYTNPALLCIEYSLARVLMEMGIEPDYLLGYSLGETTAAVVSGVVSLEEGIRFTIEYARLLEEKTAPAGMLAIIASESVMIGLPELFRRCSVAGRNFHGNFVVSGLPDDIRTLQGGLSRRNISSQQLPVKHGFHSELMDPVEGPFKELTDGITFNRPGIPVISALTTSRVREVTGEYLWNVTRYTVEFAQTVRSMLREDDYAFIDVGPSGTLATFVKYLLPADSGSLHLEVLNKFGNDLSLVESLKGQLASHSAH